MLQAPNPTERVHPLELWARAVESAPDFNVRNNQTCNMACALRAGLLPKRFIKDPTAAHDPACSCRVCCDWPALGRKLGVSDATLERFWAGENGSRAKGCAETMRGLIPARWSFMPQGFA